MFLSSVEIAAFQKVALMQFTVTTPVTMFTGKNEAGKSSVKEAIRFAIRGLSERVKLKGNFSELVTYGKKKGIVQLTFADSLVVRREVQTGKLTSSGSLDSDPLLVDIQLGAEDFARADPKELRKMLNELLHLEAPEKLIRERLIEHEALPAFIDKIIPFTRGNNFSAAEEAAKENASRARGAWESVTSENYGSAKAVDWEPPALTAPCPEKMDIDDLVAISRAAAKTRDDLNRQLGAMAEASQMHKQSDGAPTIEQLEQAVTDAGTTLQDHLEVITDAKDRFANDYATKRATLVQLEHQLEIAKMAASTLVCPRCDTKLHIKTKEDTSVLEVAEPFEGAEDASSVPVMVSAVQEQRAAIAQFERDHDQFVRDAGQGVGAAQAALTNAQVALTTAQRLAATPKVTEEQLTSKAEEFSAASDAYENALIAVQDAEQLREDHAQRDMKTAKAAEHHIAVAQWALIQKYLGNGPEGIPAEIARRLMQPINDQLLTVAQPWGQVPVAMDPATLMLRRTDNTPYYALSKSAQWRANAMMQLTLATFSTLKLVILDAFDILFAEERAQFIDGLEAFSQAHPSITIFVMGSMKKPVGEIDGFTFHEIIDGRLATAEAA